MQSTMFPNEIVALTHKHLVLKNNPLFVFNPYMDDGLIRTREIFVELASQER